MTAEQLIRDLSQAAGLGDALCLNDKGCARLLVDGGAFVVDMEYLTDTAVLQMYCVLDSVPATGRESLYRMLLEGNLFGHATHGATLAVDAEFADIVLSRALEVDSLSSSEFQHHVAAFLDAAKDWKGRVTKFASPVPDSAQVHGRHDASVPAGAIDPFFNSMNLRA